MTEPYDSRTLGRRVNELLLLATLRRAPMHGYQIALEIEERSGGYFAFQHGTLYPLLHRLEADGMIAGDWSDPDQGRARKEYALTEAGRTYLEESVRLWRTLTGKLSGFMEDAVDESVRTSAA